MKKFFKWVGVSFGGLLLLGLIIAALESPETKTASQQALKNQPAPELNTNSKTARNPLEAAQSALLTQVYSSATKESLDAYAMVKRNSGSSMDLCMRAGVVAEGFLQSKDELKYAEWRKTTRMHCKAAGLPD